MVPNATIGAFYGATETQRAVGYYEIPRDLTEAAARGNRPVPLGRGVKDVQLLLLNKAGRLAGIGEVADLYVRSPHLASGYTADEGATDEAFIVNPFANSARDRLYKTGDMGRYLPDGAVEWAGRNDRCVKIRGFRIALAEIETALGHHPAVVEAAVIAKEFIPEAPAENPIADFRLVAYVASDEERRSLPDRLRSFLATRLPEHMLPGHFVILDRLPLSPNGKIDYSALPEPDRTLPIWASRGQVARNDVETRLGFIFAQVLGLKEVGVNDDFFRLGGHSLLAAQATARICGAFGIGLELRTFLESPTIAALAKYLEARLKPADTTPGTQENDREEIEL
jgi:acyl-CoA synthetase (AMP-forming)/AMP-acid ligase II